MILPMPGEAFAKLYGLTGGELRVAMAMATNLTPQEVADMLGIGLQTVKTTSPAHLPKDLHVATS